MSESNLKGRSLLAILAHPDDELFISPLLANHARRGADCYLAIVTDGRFGVQPHTGGIAGDGLAALRKKELHAAASALGIRAPIELGFLDGFSHKTAELGGCLDDVSSLCRKVLALFEEITPDAVITFGGDGIYAHPDHLLVGNAVSAAYQSKRRNFPLFYPGINEEQVPAGLADLIRVDSNGRIPLFTLHECHLPVRIEVSSGDLDVARRSLACHASQFEPKERDLISDLFHSHSSRYFRRYSGGTTASTSLFEEGSG
jgi:LmbE family N-acetylglucosaminyl deacetylase